MIDAETRHLPPSQAGAIVEGIVRRAVEQKVPYIYKKTDSALRGNVGAELGALLAASGEKALPFLPAYPQIDRCTRGGVHYIEGRPVAESVFGIDPFEPVRHSDIAGLIGAQSGVPVHSLPADAPRPRGAGHLRLRRILPGGPGTGRPDPGCGGPAAHLGGVRRVRGGAAPAAGPWPGAAAPQTPAGPPAAGGLRQRQPHHGGPAGRRRRGRLCPAAADAPPEAGTRLLEHPGGRSGPRPHRGAAAGKPPRPPGQQRRRGQRPHCGLRRGPGLRAGGDAGTDRLQHRRPGGRPAPQPGGGHPPDDRRGTPCCR